MTIHDDIFKPRTFEEYIGQDKAKDLIQVMLDAAEQEDRFYPNFLLTGPAGLGKTSLAQIIFSGIPHRFIDGGTANTVLEDLRGFTIIDEIHNLKDESADALNVLIDDSKIIIIGCTTNPGMLPGPFRSRFQVINLNPYTDEELVQIMRNVLIRKDTLKIEDEYLYEIARRGRETPRTVLKYLSFIMDLMIVRKVENLTQNILDIAFDMLGVDEQGLTELDRRYLEAFPIGNHPVGIHYLQAVLAQDKETIEEEIEPYLLHLKLIDRTPRGRTKITDNDSAALIIAEDMFKGV